MISQVGLRASTRATARAVNLTTKRPFSIRNFLRNGIEPHPHGRYPVTARVQRGSTVVSEAKRVGFIAACFIPGIGTLLGWPMAAKALAQGHV